MLVAVSSNVVLGIVLLVVIGFIVEKLNIQTTVSKQFVAIATSLIAGILMALIIDTEFSFTHEIGYATYLIITANQTAYGLTKQKNKLIEEQYVDIEELKDLENLKNV